MKRLGVGAESPVRKDLTPADAPATAFLRALVRAYLVELYLDWYTYIYIYMNGGKAPEEKEFYSLSPSSSKDFL